MAFSCVFVFVPNANQSAQRPCYARKHGVFALPRAGQSNAVFRATNQIRAFRVMASPSPPPRPHTVYKPQDDVHLVSLVVLAPEVLRSETEAVWKPVRLVSGVLHLFSTGFDVDLGGFGSLQLKI